MYYYLVLGLSCWLNIACSQVFDDFSDGNFSSNPLWMGDTSNFKVHNEVLFLSGPAITDTSYLSTKSSASLNAEWKIKIDLNFNPSSSNYVKVYLTSSNRNLTSSLKGYYVKIGASSDEISLYRQDGFLETEIIDGIDNRVNLSLSSVSIYVKRDSAYKWSLFSDSTGGSSYSSEGTCYDSTFKSSNYFGISCRYTSTRSTKMSFDNIEVSGSPYIDNIKPEVVGNKMTSPNTWEINFSEEMDSTSIIVANIISSNLNMSQAHITYVSSSHSLALTVNNSFLHGRKYSVKLHSMKDKSGNELDQVQIHNFYNYADSIKFKDKVINETMVRSGESSSLPGTEYIELYNRSNNYYRLKNWTVKDKSSSSVIGNIILAPDEFLMLIDEIDSLEWKGYSFNKTYLNLPSLNNSGDEISLCDVNNRTVDTLTYRESQLSNFGEQDIRSLELINPLFQCSTEYNWSVSGSDLGGTPGRKNSVYDTEYTIEPFSIKKVKRVNDSAIVLGTTGYLVFNDTLIDLVKSDFKPSNINSINKELELTLSEKLHANQSYTIGFKGIKDCLGDTYNTEVFEFIYPDKGNKGDLLINEVLFNPYPSCQDFVELINTSNKYLDVSKFKLANFSNDTVTSLKSLVTDHEIISPGSILAFSEDTSALLIKYPYSVRNALKKADIPSYGNNNGVVYLLSSENQVLDAFSYDESMHLPFLENNEGVSLERISPYQPTNRRNNWISASTASGYATPGATNSHFNSGKSSSFSVIPSIFSPDNDGYQDLVTISYGSMRSGTIGNIQIYNSRGMLVNHLVSNELLSNEGFYTWNGINGDGSRVGIGYYLIVLETFDQYGKTEREIASVVVSTRLK